MAEAFTKTYYSIGEVAILLDVNASLLRFWETKFSEIKPRKNKKGTRYYTPQTIDLLKEIHYLTKDCGYTLDGAKEKLRDRKNEKNPNIETVETLKKLKEFLLELKSVT